MPRRQMTCATCGKPMYRGPGSLSQGQARCRQCRRTSEKPARPPGVCRGCGATFVRAGSGNQAYCHAPCRRPGKATSDDRGYGRDHRRARAVALAAWRDGDLCARCDLPMYHGEAVDLDHADDRTRYLGLSHAACNRSTAGRPVLAKHDAVCDHCGLTYRTQWRAQRFCSVPCRKAAVAEAKAARAAAPRPCKPVVVAPCRECGQSFDRQNGRAFCSAECRAEDHRRKARIKKRVAAGNPVDAPVRTYTRRQAA